MRLRRLGLVCGMATPILWLSLIAVAGAMRPEFSHVTQYISELGERGGRTEVMMRVAAFVFTGALMLCFAAALPATLRDGWRSMLAAALIALQGLGRIGAGVFACDPGCDGLSSSQTLHGQFATLGFLSGVLATVAWGLIFRRHAWLRGLSAYSIGTGMQTLCLLVLMRWGGNPVHAPGLFEHLATGVLSVWMLVFAVCLMRRAGAQQRRL